MPVNPALAAASQQPQTKPTNKEWNAADFFNPEEWRMSFKEDWERFLSQRKNKLSSPEILREISNRKIHQRLNPGIREVIHVTIYPKRRVQILETSQRRFVTTCTRDLTTPYLFSDNLADRLSSSFLSSRRHSRQPSQNAHRRLSNNTWRLPFNTLQGARYWPNYQAQFLITSSKEKARERFKTSWNRRFSEETSCAMLSLKLLNLAYLTIDNIPCFFGNRKSFLNVVSKKIKDYYVSPCAKHNVLMVLYRKEVIDIAKQFQAKPEKKEPKMMNSQKQRPAKQRGFNRTNSCAQLNSSRAILQQPLAPFDIEPNRFGAPRHGIL